MPFLLIRGLIRLVNVQPGLSNASRGLRLVPVLFGRSHYDTLGLESNASSEDIKKAYYDLSKRLHPDTRPDQADEAVQRYQEVKDAYAVLSDPKERRYYDRNTLGKSASVADTHFKGDGFYDSRAEFKKQYGRSARRLRDMDYWMDEARSDAFRKETYRRTREGGAASQRTITNRRRHEAQIPVGRMVMIAVICYLAFSILSR